MLIPCFRPAVALICLPLAAQTFIVDLGNGPGAHFTSIAAAVAAVPDGSVLIVRSGYYFEAVTIDQKSLTLLGEQNARLYPNGNGGGFRIRNLLPAQRVTVRNLEINFTVGSDPTIYCENNLGLVVIDNASPMGRSSLQASGCAGVTVRDCNFGLTPTSQNTGSIALTNSVAAFERVTAIDVRTSLSLAQFTDCTLTGSGTFGLVLLPAIAMNGGDVRLCGGTVAGPSVGIHPAVSGNGVARLDPATTMIGSMPWFAPGITVMTSERHAVVTTLPGAGTTVLASAAGPAGSLGILLLGFAVPAQPLPGLDPLWLDATHAVIQAFGVHGPGAPIAATVPLPAPGTFAGAALAWQALALLPAGGIDLSAPSMLALR